MKSDGHDALIQNGDGRPSFKRKKRAHRRTHGKISFSDLAKRIGHMWNSLDANNRLRYEAGAGAIDKRFRNGCIFQIK